jgi:hypothetical protein
VTKEFAPFPTTGWVHCPIHRPIAETQLLEMPFLFQELHGIYQQGDTASRTSEKTDICPRENMLEFWE